MATSYIDAVQPVGGSTPLTTWYHGLVGPLPPGTHSTSSSATATHHPSPPPSPQSSTAHAPQPAAMSEPTITDVVVMLKSLSKEMTTMKADMAAMKEKSALSSDNGTNGRSEGPRDLDRPSEIPKTRFPPL